jgi:hypothetical protein
LYQPMNVTFVDAREFDGDPYEVAGQAVAMADGILQVAERAIEVGNLMARNAEMERNMALGQPPAGDEWPDTPQGKLWKGVEGRTNELRKRLRTLKAAAEYDPKHPPRNRP